MLYDVLVIFIDDMNQLLSSIDYMCIKFVFQDIDYILWTGDLPPHDVWNQTREENLKIMKDTVEQMSSMFPGIPIFPALGNHEAAPVNRYIY